MKPETLKKEVLIRCKIYLDALFAFKVVNQILRNEVSEYKRDQAKWNNAFLQYTSLVCWKQAVIELCKLVHDSRYEVFNLFQLLRDLRLEKNIKHTSIEVEQIEKWEHLIKNIESGIQDLVLQRNKLYAHTSRNVEGIGNSIEMGHMQEIFKTVGTILIQINELLPEPNELPIPLDSILVALENIIDLLSNQTQDIT
jgi:hypothetical protein